ncbi:MAG: class I SAM-dependent methyltransferase [Verrucomicrobia bacterium]|nr:class I SAM-dependent methyltransferase [Verrucomicrobiota bacterium]
MHTNARTPHRFVLYSAAAQEVDADLDFVRRLYRRRHARAPQRLREDFCGTAKLACAWVADRADCQAWGVDLDPAPLTWGDRHYRQPLGSAAERVHLLQQDVLRARTPPADVLLALNFSYFVFQQRAALRAYLRRARAALAPGGVAVFDIFGGTGAVTATREQTMIRGARGPDGARLPAFRFTWEHAHYDAVTQRILCHMHFEIPGVRRYRKAFTYDWRLWTITELRELLSEAGFKTTEVYTHGFDKRGTSDGIYRRVKRFDNQIGWLAYVAAWR